MTQTTDADVLAPLTGAPHEASRRESGSQSEPAATGSTESRPAGDLDAAAGRLAKGLAARAQAQGVLDVAYRTLDSPLGTLLVAATEAGLVRIAFEGEDEDTVLSELSARVSPRVLKAPARLDSTAGELDEYFSGTRRYFDLPLDMQLARGFRRDVLERLREVGYGATTSYATLAAAAGSPRAVRAAGSACATNPLPLVVPCHRVLRSDGGLGGYRGGVEAKRTLLALEAGRSACGRAMNKKSRPGGAAAPAAVPPASAGDGVRSGPELA